MKHSVTVSAPGKLMLLGEHAVVYNHPCIVTAVNQRLYATIKLLDKPEVHITAKDIQVQSYTKSLKDLGKGNIPKSVAFIEYAMSNMYKRYAIKHGVTITTSSEFSSHFGFGSSSAVTVCIIKALAELFDVSISLKEIFTIAYEVVLDVQKKGSGFDIAAATYGKTLHFVTGGTRIEPLTINRIPLIVGYSGVKADTVSLIDLVKQKMEQDPEAITTIYSSIARLVPSAEEALLASDWKRLGVYMNQNQKYLQELGVSTDKLDAMIHAAKNAGAYGAKLSGAGGGDCMIALTSEEKKEAVEEAIKNAGGTIMYVETNAEGVRIEKNEYEE